jgi:hypothetical protein
MQSLCNAIFRRRSNKLEPKFLEMNIINHENSNLNIISCPQYIQGVDCIAPPALILSPGGSTTARWGSSTHAPTLQGCLIYLIECTRERRTSKAQLYIEIGWKVDRQNNVYMMLDLLEDRAGKLTWTDDYLKTHYKKHVKKHLQPFHTPLTRGWVAMDTTTYFSVQVVHNDIHTGVIDVHISATTPYSITNQPPRPLHYDLY